MIPFVIGVVGCFQVNGPGVVGNCAAVASYIVGVGCGFSAWSLYSCQAVEAVIGIGGCSCCIGDTGDVSIFVVGIGVFCQGLGPFSVFNAFKLRLFFYYDIFCFKLLPWFFFLAFLRTK